ncbi:hypothetical protein [Desulfuromonas thiophila]|uniref:hypothetical protein n=1 Tax=Desulfuromonas thiophila TaxID=57664 RepID=UPI0029F4F180|nr:hypothetical protein [Desulfuromonas thiophila]
MCFVLDSNSFHCFFNPACSAYYDFEPLHNWLYKTTGTKIVYGGTTNLNEISRLEKYLPYLVELRKISKLIQIDTKLVDEETERIKAVINNKDCDDPHIIALLAVSGCLVFASQDKRADKYIKRKNLYPKNTPRRSIYRQRSHSNLLKADNIVTIQNEI